MNASGQVTGYSYNASNELTLLTPPTGAPTTSAYDANGNLILKNTGGALMTYTWDSKNRLLVYSAPTGIETYTYSADGMRQEKVNSSGTVFYVRDGQNILIKSNASLVAQVKYTDLPGIWAGSSRSTRADRAASTCRTTRATRFRVFNGSSVPSHLFPANSTSPLCLIPPCW